MPSPVLTLEEIREDVSSIDRRLLLLLAERRALSLEVAKNKIISQKPVRDEQREQLLLAELVKIGHSYALDPLYVTHVFQTIIEDSVLFQQAFLQNLSNPDLALPMVNVAFLGGKGSYSNLAARHFFARKNKKLHEISCDSFKQIIQTVESGNADYAVLPIENTSSGSINEVYDELQHTKLSIVGEILQPIEHGLLVAAPTTLENIHTLYTHPQPFQQCSEFLRSLAALNDGKEIKQEYCSSTAEAMALVAKLGSAQVAAIGSPESGKLYGLSVLKNKIANQSDNLTRFIVVARKAVDVSKLVPAKTTFIMSTAQQAGSLVECLLVLREHQINMTKLESRPIIGNPWEEMFYVDIEANVRDDKTKAAFEQLTKLTRFIKVLGCYPSENVKPTEFEY